MTLTRREFLAVTAAGAAGLHTVARGAHAESEDAAADPLVYVGTYTDDGRSAGIYLCRMSASTGALRLVGPAATATNPSYVAATADGRFVYAVNEVTTFEGRPSGAVSAYARDRATGTLALLNQQPTGGGAPCYATLDRTGRCLLVANYVGGSVAAFPIAADGRLGDATAFVQHEGKGADPERQGAPHAHCIVPDPANRFALVADLGTDRIVTYRLDARAGTLARANEVRLAPGAGPRHLVFHRNGRVVYVVNELDSTITSLRYDAATGALTPRRTISTVAAGRTERNAPADVHVHPSGRFLYMSNRGHDDVAAFAIDATTAELRPLQHAATGGRWPRNFALDPSGRFLLVANQRSDGIVTHRVDARSGRLTPTGHTLAIPAPVCLRFVGGDPWT